MRQLLEIANEKENMGTIVHLTNAFEGIASIHISQIKNEVSQAQGFFSELWNIYRQIRVDDKFRFGRESSDTVSQKTLFIIVSAHGGFSGDIDQRLVESMVSEYDPAKQDIIVVGYHGTILLAQRGIKIKKFFELPGDDHNINVEPLVREVKQYKTAVVFYETYLSLMSQDIRRLEMNTAIEELSLNAVEQKDTITERNYIFEPSTREVIAHLERSMLQITLSQLILDSKLAQYASRFRAMSTANDRADETFSELKLDYNRLRRYRRDDQLKQMVYGLKKVKK